MICMQKMNVISKLVVILEQCRYTKTAQRMFKYSDIQYISLTLDKKLNSLVYRTLFYINIYESYKLVKQFDFCPPCSLHIQRKYFYNYNIL